MTRGAVEAKKVTAGTGRARLTEATPSGGPVDQRDVLAETMDRKPVLCVQVAGPVSRSEGLLSALYLTENAATHPDRDQGQVQSLQAGLSAISPKLPTACSDFGVLIFRLGTDRTRVPDERHPNQHAGSQGDQLSSPIAPYSIHRH